MSQKAPYRFRYSSLREVPSEELKVCIDAIKRVIAGMVRNPFDREDLVSEACLRLTKYIANFKGKSSLKTYVYTLARRVVLDYLTKMKKGRKNIVVSYEDFHRRTSDEESDLIEMMDQRDRMENLREALSDLTEAQRSSVEGVLQGMTYDEIARACGFSRGTVCSGISAAKRNLRKSLGITPPVEGK